MVFFSLMCGFGKAVFSGGRTALFVFFENEPDLFHIFRRARVAGKGFLNPFKQPGIYQRRDSVVDPFPLFPACHELCPEKKAHVTGCGGRSYSQKFRDLAEAEFLESGEG